MFIWPVKLVPEMTYNVSSGTLNPTHTHDPRCMAPRFENQHVVADPITCSNDSSPRIARQMVTDQSFSIRLR